MRPSKSEYYDATCEEIYPYDNEELLDKIAKQLGEDIKSIIFDDVGPYIAKNPFVYPFLRGFYLGMEMQKHKLEEGGE